MADFNCGGSTKVLYANLLRSGYKLYVDNASGRLVVDGDLDALSPVHRNEIIERAQVLVELLTPLPPPELEPYFGRLLYLDEMKEGLWAAERVKVKVDATPVNGGWLLITA